MKKTVMGIALAAIFLVACNKGFEKTENGVQYKILAHEDGSRAVQAGDITFANLRISTESTDSVIMETFTSNNPRYVPADDPSMKEALLMLAKGDSVEIIVNADTLFQKTFGLKEKPEGLKSEQNIRIILKIIDVLDQKELDRVGQEQVREMKEKDSVELQAYVATLENVKKTASGLMYIVEKEGKGKAPKRGDKVTVNYKGYFMNGKVFDSSDDRGPAELAVGLQQVIPGWEEALMLMHEGSKYKLIVPWNLAYGESGAGPIMPCTSLVFEVELLKVK